MTLPDPIEPAPAEEIQTETEQIAPKKRHRIGVYLIGILILLIGAGLGGLFGYRAGVNLRLQAQQDQKVMAATNQYQLGLVDLQAGRYETAKKRFEHVIHTDPNFPGAADQLARAMLEMSLALTPTPEPTPTLAPTPDLRGEEEMFANIQQSMANQDWEGAIASIEALRDLNLTYRAVDLDGMYYISLRFLGVQNILNEGELEVGIYHLTLAERFAPLDVDANNYRIWARQYIAAASFWKIDWPKVIAYFAEIYPALPNLRDSSGMTATERYRQALIGYGDKLVMDTLYCDAQIQYEAALQFSSPPDLQTKATSAAEMCAGGPPPAENGAPPVPTVTPTPGTLTPGVPTALETPILGETTPTP